MAKKGTSDKPDVDLEKWILLKTPPDGDCGFHSISLAMRIFYKNQFPFLTDNEKENVQEALKKGCH